MTDFVAWLKGPLSGHPVHIAAEAHHRLVTIHPFVDGNGRTARLLMNLLLLQGGYPPAIVRPQDRRAYINSLEQPQTGGSADDYFRLIYQAVDHSFDLYLDAARGVTPDEGLVLAPQVGSRVVRRAQLAQLTGIRPSTLKHYSELGLLPFHQEDAGLARRYDVDVATRRLEAIAQLRAQGLSLDEIRGRLRQEPDSSSSTAA
jgi:hypothetical protein